MESEQSEVNMIEQCLKKFHSLKNDAFYSRHYGQLTKEEIRTCEDFIREYGKTGRELKAAANRMFVIYFRDRAPKTLAKGRLMSELMSVSGCVE